jgi:hypothetical protein
LAVCRRTVLRTGTAAPAVLRKEHLEGTLILDKLDWLQRALDALLGGMVPPKDWPPGPKAE